MFWSNWKDFPKRLLRVPSLASVKLGLQKHASTALESSQETCTHTSQDSARHLAAHDVVGNLLSRNELLYSQMLRFIPRTTSHLSSGYQQEGGCFMSILPNRHPSKPSSATSMLIHDLLDAGSRELFNEQKSCCICQAMPCFSLVSTSTCTLSAL